MRSDTNISDKIAAQRWSFLPQPALIARLIAVTLLLGTATAALAKDEEEEKIPEPEDITLKTKDGVMLRCTWYAGTEGKQSVPVICVHGYEGQRGEFDELATYLQNKGHAVICPDLRGHGGSTTQELGEEDRELDLKRFRTDDFGDMIRYDMEAVKSFLMKENNKAELNVEMLCVVGSEMGALVAMNWAGLDWSWPQLAGMKQGQDVKALVLISPPASFKGLSTRKPLSHRVVRGELSILIAAGSRDSRTYADSKRLHTALSRFHPPVPDDPNEALKKQDLFLVSPDTNLQGTKLLKGVGLEKQISGFIELRLINREGEFAWTER